MEFVIRTMDYFCYANGKIIRKSGIKVGITDLVMLRGYGAFDFLRTYHGVPFRIQDYLSRFENSVNGMRLRLPLSKRKIETIIYTLIRKNQRQKGHHHDFGIRLLLTGGYSLDSYLPAAKPNLFILIEELPHYPEWWSQKGIKLMIHGHSREMARVKTTNYLTAIRLAEERRKKKAQDTLYVSNGKILETTRNNFFLFHGNTLVTSREDVLHGITRKAVIGLASRKFKVQTREVRQKELDTCTEAFITGTTRGITPVVRIDNKKIGNGRVGENTKILMGMLNGLIEKECRGARKRSPGV